MSKGRLMLRIGFYLPTISFFISSASVLAIPFVMEDVDNGQRSLADAIGIVFWAFLLLAAISLSVTAIVSRKNKVKAGGRTQLRLARFFRIERNAVGMLLVIAFMLGLVGLLLALFIYESNSWLATISLFLVLISLEMQGMWNGTIRKALVEHQKKASETD